MNAPFLIETVVPITLVILMTTAGLNIKLSTLSAFLLQPHLWIVLTVSQFLLIPPLMLLIVAVIDVDKITAITLVAIGAAPGGALSNIVTLLARGNLELSIILTVSSTIASTMVSPILMALSVIFLAVEEVNIKIDALAVVFQMFLFVLLPLATGAMLARTTGSFARVLKGIMPLVCVAAIIFTLILSSVISWPMLNTAMQPVVFAAIGFSLAAWIIGRIITKNRPQAFRTATSVEFGMRNLPIALFLVGHFTKEAQAVACLLMFLIINTFCFLVYAWFERNRTIEVHVSS